jgi:hypothetical protein
MRKPASMKWTTILLFRSEDYNALFLRSRTCSEGSEQHQHRRFLHWKFSCHGGDTQKAAPSLL